MLRGKLWHVACACGVQQMSAEQVAAFLPLLGLWLTAGLVSGWAVGVLRGRSSR
jgi:hypothetical protein